MGVRMDFLLSRSKTMILMVSILGIGIMMLSTRAFAGSDILKDFSFDDCDPFEARAPIMSVNGKKAQLVAGEQTIYVVDLGSGDQRLITELADADGNRIDFKEFNRGQWIYVKGFKHINGGVVASLVQKIDQPQKKKPALHKIIKNSKYQKKSGDRRHS